MGLMKKLFGAAAPDASAAAQFEESRDALQQTRSRNGPRRDLVKLTLRETTRKHGIPSDWIDCRALSVLTRQHKSGMHVQFLVRKADQQLLHYVHAFQESFWEQILRMDPHARQWLFSVGWEFHGETVQGFSRMPDPTSWKDTGDDETVDAMAGAMSDASAAQGADTQPPEEDSDALASDLAALQAAISMPGDSTKAEPAAAPSRRRDS